MEFTGRSRHIAIVVTWAACAAFSGRTLAAQAQLAFSLNDQGLEAAAHSDYARAERLYGGAIQIWRGLGSAYEAHTASALVNLGQTLSIEGKVSGGVRAYEEALALNRRSLGSTHLRTVSNLTALGYAYVLLGDAERADAALSEALETARALYSGDLLLAHTLMGLSVQRRQAGRLDEALQLGEEALDAALKAGGELSSGAAVSYENVARIHRLAERPERALPLFRKARFIYERILDPGSPILASLASEEGLVLLDDGETALAEQKMSQAASALGKMGPPCEQRLAVAETNLGLLRLRQQKYSEADRLLTHSLALQRQLPFQPASDIAVTLRTLAQLRKAQRREAESAKLIAQAAGIQAGH